MRVTVTGASCGGTAMRCRPQAISLRRITEPRSSGAFSSIRRQRDAVGNRPRPTPGGHLRGGKTARLICRSVPPLGQAGLPSGPPAVGKAVVAYEFGGPEVLSVEAQPMPTEMLPSQVIIEMHAAGVNPADTYIRSGSYRFLPDRFPFTPGIEGGGTVIAAGRDVTSLRPGDRCIFFGHHGQQTGSHATYCTADAAICHRLPASVDLTAASGSVVAYWTAYRALVQKGRPVEPGDSLLIHGASGAVGQAALQTALLLGVRKICCSAGTQAGRDRLLRQGAAMAVDHCDPHHMDRVMEFTSGHGVDMVLEMLSNANLGQDLRALAREGCVKVIGSRGPAEIDARDLMMQEGTIHGIYLWSATYEERCQATDFLCRALLLRSGKPLIGKAYPLSDAVEAHREVMRRDMNLAGKIILSCRP